MSVSASQYETCLEEAEEWVWSMNPSVHSQLASALGRDTPVCMPVVPYPPRVTAAG